jgi:UDPglucose--hexose-1-phosphate uridylyltransferase
MKAHRRQNPLTGEWVLVSPHRTQRPWLGQIEKSPPEDLVAYDPSCYLCPGNLRADGKRNPEYDSTYVFENDFPALLLPGKDDSLEEYKEISTKDIIRAQPEFGTTRVMCFSPRHDLSLPELPISQVEAVVQGWVDQTQELGQSDQIAYVQIFENKGAMMGASNPHPHNQIWASSHIPNEPAKETLAMREYLDQHDSCLICSYLQFENGNGERIVAQNEHFISVVPFWAVWPFELLIISKRHIGLLTDLSSEEKYFLADILRKITTRYDNLFESPFPYSMGFHQAPLDGNSYPAWHLHAHYYPPLLRSATVRKFMVGYEMLAMPQRDLTPESAADRLRSMSEIHYRVR